MYRRASLTGILVLAALGAAPVVHAAPRHLAANDARQLAGGGATIEGHQAVLGARKGVRNAAWRHLEAEVGPALASWSAQTKLPNRILLSGVDVPDSIAIPKAAEAFAVEFLERHLDLLAPGSAIGDFVLVTNDLSSGVRSVGFTQMHTGLPVLGGQVSFRFKFDRLVMIGSEAYPSVAVPTRTKLVDASTATNKAKAWIEDGRTVTAKMRAPVIGPFILPIAVAGKPLEFREVVVAELDVEGAIERWEVFVDAEDGAPIARQQTLLFGTSTLLYNVPERHPLSTRANLVAPNVLLSTPDGGQTSGANGSFSFIGASADVTPSVTGTFVMVGTAAGELPSQVLPGVDGSPTVWDESSGELGDAALSAYVHTGIVKDFVRAIDPDLAWLDNQISVTVNIDDTCNAFSDGDSINFFQAGRACQNTGLIADVIYHEFGHSVHSQAVLPGVGQFNVALSEGVSDYLSATMTEDSGLGRGFYFSDEPLRDFDPPGFEYRWPEDRGEVHDEGRIIGGALWDLRKLLIVDLGEFPGRNYADKLWYETIRRAVDIPSMYPEALLFDDDDGNLANGTPRGCLINEAYGAHGLFSAGEGSEQVSVAEDDGLTVTLSLSIPNFPGCPVDAVPELRWRLRDQPSEEVVLPMNAGLDGLYSLTIPEQAAGQVVQYQVHVNYSVGSVRSFPDNIADPWYEYFFGEVTPLRCITDPWETASDGNGANWVVGPWASADDAATDPVSAFDVQTHAYQPGKYSPFTDTTLTFDPVSTGGNSNIRLQYYRWLSVEDGFFDSASIRANGANVWQNIASADESQASIHHVDKEWRFHDVDLSQFAADGEIQLQFTQTSDQGLEFGGWTVAAMCLVAFDPDGQPCGDTLLDAGEECDDGNTVDGDGCSALCTAEGDIPPTSTSTTGGDSDGETVGDSDDPDSDETESGTGGDTDTDGGFANGDSIPRGCACDAGPTDRTPPMWLGLLGLGLLGFVRRRR